MANNGRTQIGKIARWKLLEARVRERLAELPGLAEDHAELQRIIAEAEALESKFQFHRAASQDATEKRNAIAAAGEELRSRMALVLQYQLGTKSKLLMEFGLRPRPGRPAQKRGTPEEPAGSKTEPTPEPVERGAEGEEAPTETAA